MAVPAARDILMRSPLMPVVAIADPEHAIPLAEALLAGGINVIEITLRTPSALDAIGRVARDVPEMLVGAGTVLNAAQLVQAQQAGARFALSPGVTSGLVAAAASVAMPLIPGVATASEIMLGLDAGLDTFKLFPAQQLGGVAMLKALQGPFPHCRFCPTGGITAATAADFLALENVSCVGGSWLAPAGLQQQRDWAAITRLASAASVLGRRS